MNLVIYTYIPSSFVYNNLKEAFIIKSALE